MLVEAGVKEFGTRYIARVTAEETARYAAVVASQKIGRSQRLHDARRLTVSPGA